MDDHTAESASKHSMTEGEGGSSGSVAGPSAGSPAGHSMSAEPWPVCEAAALCGRQLAAGRTVDLQGQNRLFKGRAVQLF